MLFTLIALLKHIFVVKNCIAFIYFIYYISDKFVLCGSTWVQFQLFIYLYEIEIWLRLFISWSYYTSPYDRLWFSKSLQQNVAIPSIFISSGSRQLVKRLPKTFNNSLTFRPKLSSHVGIMRHWCSSSNDGYVLLLSNKLSNRTFFTVMELND